MLEQLGQGSTAVVYHARQCTDGRHVVLKFTRTDDEEVMAFAMEEYNLLKQIKHPHIIEALDFDITPNGTILFLDFFGGTTVQRMVRKSCGMCLPDSAASELVKMLLQAIDHLHKNHIVHRDIKPQNLLVQSDCSDLKIIDFNTARYVAEAEPLTMTGTKAYMPPEVLLGASPSQGSDVWAAGMCLHFMLTGYLLSKFLNFSTFDDFADEMALFRTSLQGDQWEHVSRSCKLVLCCSLEADPILRPTASQILSHLCCDLVN